MYIYAQESNSPPWVHVMQWVGNEAPALTYQEFHENITTKLGRNKSSVESIVDNEMQSRLDPKSQGLFWFVLQLHAYNLYHSCFPHDCKLLDEVNVQ